MMDISIRTTISLAVPRLWQNINHAIKTKIMEEQRGKADFVQIFHFFQRKEPFLFLWRYSGHDSIRA